MHGFKAIEHTIVDVDIDNVGAILNLLLGRPGIMRGSAVAYFLVWLGNACINSQFGNYVNHLFGWGPQESAPLLVPAASDPQTRTRALAPSLGEPSPEPGASRGGGRAVRRSAPLPPSLGTHGTHPSLPRRVRRCSSA